MTTMFIATLALPQVAQAKTYRLKIGNVAVTDDNKNDLTVISGVSGKTVKYDSKMNSLLLRDATINITADVYGIESKIDNMKIIVLGNCKVTTAGFGAIKSEDSKLTITGGGTLKVSAANYGLYPCNKTSMVIDGCTIESDGAVGSNNIGIKMTVRNATLTAKPKSSSYYQKTLYSLEALELDGCAITRPAGAQFNASLHGVAQNGNLVGGIVKIEPTYNGGDILLHESFENGLPNGWTLIDDDKDGRNWYSTTTNSLSWLVPHSGTGAMVSFSWISQNITANNHVVTPLLPKGAKTVTYYVAMNHAALERHYLCFSNDKPTNFYKSEKIEFSEAEPIGLKTQSIWYKVTRNLPKGTRYVSFNHDDEGQNYLLLDDVTICGDSSGGVESVNTDKATCRKGIYNLMGVRLDTDFDNLPAGLYIVDGKKVIKK